MIREQASNTISAIPSIGFPWTIGWELGRGIVNTSGYQHFKANAINFFGGYYQVPVQYQKPIITWPQDFKSERQLTTGIFPNFTKNRDKV